MTDEDFPPGVTPYSSTTSAQKSGRLSYFTGDIGYNILKASNYKLGLFAGVNYYSETVNAYGCGQTAGNPAVCAAPVVGDEFLTITESSAWKSVRVGMSGEVTLWDRLKLSAELAWLPVTSLEATDTHWLRIQPGVAGNFTGPIPEDGTGHNGWQAEGIVSYAVSNAFSFGIGGRYWRMETTQGNAHFENAIIGGGGAPQGITFATERYGVFVQGSYHF